MKYLLLVLMASTLSACFDKSGVDETSGAENSEIATISNSTELSPQDRDLSPLNELGSSVRENSAY